MRSVILAAVLLLVASPAIAQPQMEMNADTTTYDDRAHTYTAQGDVHIALPQLQVSCQEAVITANAAGTRVLKIVFTGDVEAKRGQDVLHAETITLFVPERRLVAAGGTHIRLRLPDSASGTISGP
ncbi:MAG TPA: hypothetical protein V6D47_02905 [Oscillatoriaceae cyanobacterium]